MRGDVMRWVGRLVAGVLGLGVLALLGAVIVTLRQAQGLPPMPILLGILGLVVLILLAGACLALISVAVSLRRLAMGGAAGRAGAVPVLAATRAPDMQGPFSPTALREVPPAAAKAEAAAAAGATKAGRTLIAER